MKINIGGGKFSYFCKKEVPALNNDKNSQSCARPELVGRVDCRWSDSRMPKPVFQMAGLIKRTIKFAECKHGGGTAAASSLSETIRNAAVFFNKNKYNL